MRQRSPLPSHFVLQPQDAWDPFDAAAFEVAGLAQAASETNASVATAAMRIIGLAIVPPCHERFCGSCPQPERCDSHHKMADLYCGFWL
jgi:hypothetical protein